jgi:hypothetical protein
VNRPRDLVSCQDLAVCQSGREPLARIKAEHYLPKPYQLDELLKVLEDAYAERLKKKFAADAARTQELLKISQEDSPRGILRHMKEMDYEER